MASCHRVCFAVRRRIINSRLFYSHLFESRASSSRSKSSSATSNHMNEDIYKCEIKNDGESIRIFMEDLSSSSMKSPLKLSDCSDTSRKYNANVLHNDQSDDEKKDNNDDDRTGMIPETVLQYERQMRKLRAADRAGSEVTKDKHLRVIYVDDHLVVTDKPSGVLCVPGVNNNPSLVTVVHQEFGSLIPTYDHMIVHRLDMDTSGLVVFGRTPDVVSKLHETFREKKVEKMYEALVCGHVSFNEGLIDLPLQKDHEHPPFMRVSTPKSEHDAAIVVKDLQHNGWKKILMKKPKQSQTKFSVIERTFYPGTNLPVTRLALVPITGRTHQLRVHCAAMGHPIVADPTYGIYGESSANGGFSELAMDIASPQRADLALQLNINSHVQDEEMTMCLHAKTLKLSHPVSSDLLSFEAVAPF